MASSIQGIACPLTQPTSPARPGLSGSGPHMAQLSTLPSQHTQSPWVYHFVLIPLPATSSNQVSLGAAQALFGRGGICQPGSLPGVLRQAQWVQAWGCSHPGPRAGPRDLFVLKHSPYCFFSVLYTFWSPIFINAGVLLAVRFVPQ